MGGRYGKYGEIKRIQRLRKRSAEFPLKGGSGKKGGKKPNLKKGFARVQGHK